MGISVQTAAARLKAASEIDTDEAEALVYQLERLVLDHEPRSFSEAVVMLDVALSDLVAGGRCDGRDVGAVSKVRDFLAVQID